MAKQDAFGFRMGELEVKYSREGYNYFIHNKYDDRVISCWAVGSKRQVEARAKQSVANMNKRDNSARLQSKHQKSLTMKSSSYGKETIGTKLRGIERA